MANMRKLVGEVPGPGGTFAVPVELLGPPGLSQTLHIVDVTKAGETPRATGRRPFQMWGALMHFEPPPADTISTTPTGGDTHLDFGCHNFGMEGGSVERPLKLKFFSNQHGRLGSVQSTVEAESWDDAFGAFRTAVSHLLSIWSWQHGVPLVLTAVGGRDEKSGTTHQTYIRALPIVERKPTVGTWIGASPSFLAAASYYREGVGSPSAPYRLLCFFKLFLTLKHVLRDFEKRSVSAGLTTQKDLRQALEVRVEQSDLAAEVWPDAIGWRIGKLATDKVRDLRNRVGHELFEEETTFNNFDDPARWDSTRDAGDAFLPLLRRYAEKLGAFHKSVIAPAEAKK